MIQIKDLRCATIMATKQLNQFQEEQLASKIERWLKNISILGDIKVTKYGKIKA